MDSGIDHRARRAVPAVPHDVHRRLRPHLGVRPRARLRRARQGRARCRTASRPSTTRRCSRPATWSACLPALVWHLEDPRVGQSYPNYYVARLASKFVKVVLSGAGGDELFAGYPWRYYRAVVNDDFDHYVEKYYALLAAARCRTACISEFFRAGRLERGRGRADDRHLPRRDARPARAPRVARGVRQPLALLRGEDVPPRPAARRGQAEHGARPRDARAVPRQRPRRLRAAAAGAAEAARPRARRAARTRTSPAPKTERYFDQTRDGKLILRKVLSSYVSGRRRRPDQAGLLGPGRELVPRREHRLRERR